MEVKPVLNPVRNRTGDPKNGETASFMRGWVLMKLRFASESSLLLLGQEPARQEKFWVKHLGQELYSKGKVRHFNLKMNFYKWKLLLPLKRTKNVSLRPGLSVTAL